MISTENQELCLNNGLLIQTVDCLPDSVLFAEFSEFGEQTAVKGSNLYSKLKSSKLIPFFLNCDIEETKF